MGPWARRTHEATLPGDAMEAGAAARDGGGAMKMGSRMTPCCPESGSAWVQRGHSAGLPSRKLVLSTSRKGSVRMVCHTHDAHHSLRLCARVGPQEKQPPTLPACPPIIY